MSFRWYFMQYSDDNSIEDIEKEPLFWYNVVIMTTSPKKEVLS